MADPRSNEDGAVTLESIFASTWFGTAILSGAFLAIQFLMVTYIVLSFLKKTKPQRSGAGRLRFVVISLVIFMTSWMDGILDIWEAYHILYTAAVSGEPFSSVYASEFQTFERRKYMIIGDAMLAVTIAVGDALMLWRCFILWGQRRWVALFPLFTCVSSIAFHIFYLARTAKNGPNAYTELWASRAIMFAVSLSVATNIMITSLILLRLNITRRRALKDYPEGKTSPWYWDVTVMVVESAFPLAFFRMCWMTSKGIALFSPPSSSLHNGRLNATTTIFALLYSSFCAISPQIIIFANFNQKVTDRYWRRERRFR
ncbi:hypothetical protein BKA70DRAFT_548662 [Coprinopsis sp. MPI-PUGE-AT-0042]|nr:hypothetical protein BKA70DRAFT_548662 [Coprinopsis sp. MPI-PUGE-AT-0042]